MERPPSTRGGFETGMGALPGRGGACDRRTGDRSRRRCRTSFGPGARGSVQAEAELANGERRGDRHAGAAVERNLDGAAAELRAGGRETRDGGGRELGERWLALREGVVDAENVSVDADDVAPLEVREDAGASDLERIGHISGRAQAVTSCCCARLSQKPPTPRLGPGLSACNGSSSEPRPKFGRLRRRERRVNSSGGSHNDTRRRTAS